jgi:hypothetical protein
VEKIQEDNERWRIQQRMEGVGEAGAGKKNLTENHNS